jgi:hypothetical protein
VGSGTPVPARARCGHAEQRADQSQPGGLAGPPVGDGAGQVAAVGLADDQERPAADEPLDQAEQQLHHVVAAADRLRRGRPAHAGQVGVDAPVAGPLGEHRLQGAGQLAVVHAHAVQGEHGRPAAMVDEVHRDAVDGGFHEWTPSAGGRRRAAAAPVIVRWLAD